MHLTTGKDMHSVETVSTSSSGVIGQDAPNSGAVFSGEIALDNSGSDHVEIVTPMNEEIAKDEELPETRKYLFRVILHILQYEVRIFMPILELEVAIFDVVAGKSQVEFMSVPVTDPSALCDELRRPASSSVHHKVSGSYISRTV